MKKIVEVIATSLVSHPEQVVVTERQEDDMTLVELHVAAEDMGKVIGRQGRIAKAIRTVVKAAATRENQRVTVEIV
ncbi:KH domain-containing protein [Selenomonas sp. TAMA-11512]|uniref:KH domain-containing protein n=1 Tax=Selenomonas sp. TAMA-11512 TaxID=3095337 RepID=UPI00308C533D|nr:KH domain-containing protein [Selenomonas sp. TAMA-11512]